MSAHVEPVYDSREFGVLVSDRGTTTSIELAGECDLAARPALKDALTRALASGPECLVLDLSRLSFMDAAGLGVVIDLAKRADAQQVHLVICPGPPAVQRLFAFCHLTDDLLFVPPPGRLGESRDPVSPATGDAGSGSALSSRPQRRRSPSPARRPAPCPPTPTAQELARTGGPWQGRPT